MIPRRRAITIELTPAEYGAVQAESFATGISRCRILRAYLLPELARLVAKHSDRLHLPLDEGDDPDVAAND